MSPESGEPNSGDLFDAIQRDGFVIAEFGPEGTGQQSAPPTITPEGDVIDPVTGEVIGHVTDEVPVDSPEGAGTR